MAAHLAGLKGQQSQRNLYTNFIRKENSVKNKVTSNHPTLIMFSPLPSDLEGWLFNNAAMT